MAAEQLKNVIKSMNFKYIESLIFIPALAMNGTLAAIEAFQRFVYHDKERDAGVVDKVWVAPVRTLMMPSVQSWDVTIFGLKHNKRFAVYIKNPDLLRLYGSTKLGSALTNISCHFTDDACQYLCLSYEGHDDLVLSMSEISNGERMFGMKFKELSSDGREYLSVGKKADEWMTAVLGGDPVTMLYLPERKLSGERNFPIYVGPDNMPVPPPPVLIISDSSLDKMNKQAGTSIEMERFRPNIVVTGCEANAENFWKVIRIGGQLELEQTFMSPRCGVVNAFKGELNNKVIDTVRKFGPFKDEKKRACFGSYWKVLRPGKVSVGDNIVVLKSIDHELTGPNPLTNKFLLGS